MEEKQIQEESLYVKGTQEAIHEKGFDMGISPSINFGKIKVGVKYLDDAILNLGVLSRSNPMCGSKGAVLRALAERDIAALRQISEYFYTMSGVYSTVCNYFANLYRYDWYVASRVLENNFTTESSEKMVKEFAKILEYLDNSHIKKLCGQIALSVIKYGCYYGYIVPNADGLVLQELPINYCRSRFFIGGMPAVEFNMRFFDDNFRDLQYRMRILKMFPKEFQKGYALYQQRKLKGDFWGDDIGWYLLSPASTVKFNFNNNDVPIFANAIPAIIDLDAAQDLDRKKQMQKLLKILVQKLPRDKNGDLIFDVDEAKDIHNNAVEMLKKAVGVDILTTFADIDSIDMSDRNTATSVDDLEKIERAVYNSFGVSRNIFNPSGNLSLANSILDDESTVRNLLLQFEVFFEKVVQAKNASKKKYKFQFCMLETTQYNYKELSKMYKEQTQMGFSKMLPQIALGHSQSSILNTAYFENEILHLSEIMIPPLLSSTLSGEDILNRSKSSSANDNENGAGRPELPDDQKSDKTIANRESIEE